MILQRRVELGTRCSLDGHPSDWLTTVGHAPIFSLDGHQASCLPVKKAISTLGDTLKPKKETMVVGRLTLYQN